MFIELYLDASGTAIPQGSEQEGISPGLFKSIVSKGHADFQTNQQQDAVEFLLHLLDVIMKEAKKEKRENASANFGFELEERVEIGQSVQYKITHELMLGLPVDENDIENKEQVKGELDLCLMS